MAVLSIFFLVRKPTQKTQIQLEVVLGDSDLIQSMRVECSVDMDAPCPKLRSLVVLPQYFLYLILKTWLTDVTSSSIERNMEEKLCAFKDFLPRIVW